MLSFSRSVMSDSLGSHGLQQASPSPSPRSYSNSYPCVGDAIQPSCPLLSPSPPASFPASGSFLMSQLFILGDQSIRVSVSVSVLPMNIRNGFALRLTGWISLLSKGLSRVFSNTIVQNHQFFGTHPSLWSSSHTHT